MRALEDMQRHRDHWREYAYGNRDKPRDYLDGDKVDRGSTKIEQLEAQVAAVAEALQWGMEDCAERWNSDNWGDGPVHRDHGAACSDCASDRAALSTDVRKLVERYRVGQQAIADLEILRAQVLQLAEEGLEAADFIRDDSPGGDSNNALVLADAINKFFREAPDVSYLVEQAKRREEDTALLNCIRAEWTIYSRPDGSWDVCLGHFVLGCGPTLREALRSAMQAGEKPNA